MKIEIPAYAKLNLDLHVLRKRADGYHDIRTTMQAIELHDTLEISDDTKVTGFTVEGMHVDKNDNSVIKAHQALENHVNKRLPASFHLHKRIPPGSGMGGASSDAAATLRGLQKMFNLDDVDLEIVGADIGSDVPFFLQTSGAAKVEGRGERVTPIETTPTNTWFAIAWPGIELSTRLVYQAWDEVKGPDLRKAAEHVEPRLKDFAAMLGNPDEEGWRMTGSGSAFFKSTETENEAKVAIRGLDCWTAVSKAR